MNNWTTDNIPNQAGKTVIVTGANTGIGFVTAKVLAGKGATVILACRNEKRGQKAVDRIKKEFPSAKAELMILDLADLESVRKFAKEFKSKHKKLDILINNAGVMMCPYTKTKDGFELQFGTNHLGHFALTGLLMDVLEKSKKGRVVNVSSGFHRHGNIDFNDLSWEKREYDGKKAYGDSKLANLYFTYELDRRLKESNVPIIATAAHPGWTATDLQRHVLMFRFLNHFLAQKPAMGALPTLRAAIDPKVSGGDYFGPDGPNEVKGYPIRVDSNELSKNRENAKRLWEISEKLTKLEYAF